MADYFSKVISGTTRPVATTLAAQKLSGATTASLVATTGWDTGTKVHGIMYRTDAGTGAKVAGSQIDWKADVSGTTLSNFTVTAGTDDTYAIGTTVELAPTAAWGDDMATGILVSLDQDGTLKAGAVDNVAVFAAGVISSTTPFNTALNPETRTSETVFDHVASGCVWSGDSYGGSRVASMTAGVAYIGGKRVVISAVTSRTFTASKDTYVDVDNAGNLTYTEVTNNAASPALAANNIRLGIIVTGASNIANAGSVNQGQEDKILPIASSIPYAVTDSLGNLICPRDPSRKVLGQRQTVVTQTGVTTEVDITGLSVPFIAPANRKVLVTVSGPFDGGSSLQQVAVNIKEGSTQLRQISIPGGPVGLIHLTGSIELSPTSGLHTYKATLLRQGTTANVATGASSTDPLQLRVELL